LDAAALAGKYPVSFVLVGQGSQKGLLQEKARKLGLTNVTFLPPVEKASIPELLAMTDALFIGWEKKPFYRFGISPNKLMDYMMAAKPVIHAVEAGDDLVAESGCGISVPPANPEAIVASVMRLAGMTADERGGMGRRGREYVLAHHDYKVLARQFLEQL
ncbi:MAG: glycosyltransferase, partial [Nitrospiraceae bacterium]|nr:glycosyltransferase [Nitrospiraceae bacterium]